MKNRKKRLCLLTALGCLVLVLSVLLYPGCGRTDTNVLLEPQFPSKLSLRQFLKDDGLEERKRLVEYYEDGWTVKAVLIEYTTGAYLLAQYHRDGAVNNLVEFYAPDEAGNQQLKRSIKYASGGLVVLESKFYRLDGTLDAQGGLRADGLQELIKYGDDGRIMLSHQAFKVDGDIVYRKVFDHTLSKDVQEKGTDGSTRQVAFREDGTRHKRTSDSDISDNQAIEFYTGDGLVLSHVVFRYNKIGVVYFNPDGTLKEARMYDGDSLKVAVYRDGVKPAPGPFINVPKEGVAFKQHWENIDSEDPSLKLVEEFRSNGKVRRKLHFMDNELSKEQLLDGQGKVARTIILKESEADKKNTVKLVLPPGVKLPVINVEIDPQSTKLTKLEDPRPNVGPPVEPYYPYEGYEDYEEYYGYPHGYPHGEYGPDGYPQQDLQLDFP